MQKTIAMRDLTILFLSFLSTLTLVAQNSSLSGRIMDEKQHPIAFANIVLYANNKLIKGGISDSAGWYNLSDIPSRNDYQLKASCIGYEDYRKNIVIKKNQHLTDTLILQTSDILLDGVSIVARRPIYSLKKGILVTDVKNSLLNREHKMIDVLKKVPGLIYDGESFTFFGSGEPLIYINNRKIKDKEEINRLDVKNVKHIELITNPGPKYHAEGKTVLNIVTGKKASGLQIRVQTDFTQRRLFSHGEGIDVNYKKDKIDLFASYSYARDQKKSIQLFDEEVHADTLWNYHSGLYSKIRTDYHNYQAGLTYTPTDKHQVGGQFTGYATPDKITADNSTQIKVNNLEFTNLDAQNLYKTKNKYWNLSLFYNGEFTPHITFNLVADYVDKRNRQTQNVLESSEKLPEQELSLYSTSDYQVMAAKADFTYTLGRAHTLTAGADFSRVTGKDGIQTTENTIADNLYDTSEDKRAAFVEYGFSGKKISFTTGFRFENIVHKMDNLSMPEENIWKKYNHLFPFVKLDYQHTPFSTSLSYSMHTERPDFKLLNSKTYYQNRFLFQRGNPSLLPSISNIIQWRAAYKFVNFLADYTYTKDYIGMNMFSDSENTSRIIYSWKNYPTYQSLKFMLMGQYSVGCWTPSLAVGYTLPFFKFEYLGQNIKNNNPQLLIQSNHYFSLPKNFLLHVDYAYVNGGSIQIFQFRPFHILNIGIEKDFFHKQLAVSLDINDLLKTDISRYRTEINTIKFYQREDQDHRYVTLNITYRFNNYKKKRKAASAAKNEIRRL